MVWRMYQITFQRVKSAININQQQLNVASEPYLGITCHYIGDIWNMESICLTTAPLEDRHAASNIAEWLEEVAARFEISPSKIRAIVHDNGANIVAAANIL